ncbi:Oidioi.mRNA.OKI2018_I69.chr1.g2993.t1.cds [Oikopleura dioica]|uniref:Oidioi.mRNA.OKI2018_I69.chr1.g2993.t1.cds n=1 Tax=Oikopleura dioica TaxID=34765 RepID=A0ABN7T1Z0_OIKDI|nr:Oidioi.mRNA.OKI2018_I69.chr1.g2993.t1.cds [Oikopleura dioica]
MEVPLISACRDVENIRNMLENLENNLENEYCTKTVDSARFKALTRENRGLVEELKQWKKKFEQEQKAKETLVEKVRVLEAKLNESEKKRQLPMTDDNQNQACVCQLPAENEAEETFVEPPPLPEKRLRKQSSFIRPHKPNPPLFDESCVTVSSAMKDAGLDESIMTLPPEMTIISDDNEASSEQSIMINELVAAEKPSTQRVSKAIQRSLNQLSNSVNDEDFDQLESIPIPIPRLNLDGLIVKKRRDVNWDHKNTTEDTPPKKRKVAVGKTFDF